MNYRHAFHAGNVGDCMKHALLVALLHALRRKPAPFHVLDTHAGIGRYDLHSEAASRTGEWRQGIGLLLDDPPEALVDYVSCVNQLGLYPGSPALIRALLREDDRLTCCELHPDDAALLRQNFARDRHVAVHHRDGYEAIRALLPPAQRRGLVFLDPPFEQPDEFSRLADALMRARARFSGVIAAWYPIKHRAPVRAFHDALRQSAVRDVVAAELLLREPLDPTRLNGAGLLVAAPPFGFEAQATSILAALVSRLRGLSGDVHRVVDE